MWAAVALWALAEVVAGQLGRDPSRVGVRNVEGVRLVIVGLTHGTVNPTDFLASDPNSPEDWFEDTPEGRKGRYTVVSPASRSPSLDPGHSHRFAVRRNPGVQLGPGAEGALSQPPQARL